MHLRLKQYLRVNISTTQTSEELLYWSNQYSMSVKRAWYGSIFFSSKLIHTDEYSDVLDPNVISYRFSFRSIRMENYRIFRTRRSSIVFLMSLRSFRHVFKGFMVNTLSIALNSFRFMPSSLVYFITNTILS